MSLVLELLWGCIAGLVAAVCMTIFELPFWKNWGMEGVAEWQVNSAIVSVIIRKFTHRKVGQLNVGRNAPVPWSRIRNRFSRSSRLGGNNDSIVLGPDLRHCVQPRPLDNFSFPNKEDL